MKKKNIQPPQLLKDFERLVNSYGGMRAAGRELGVSGSYISLIINGYNPVPEAFLAKIKWERNEEYIKV